MRLPLLRHRSNPPHADSDLPSLSSGIVAAAFALLIKNDSVHEPKAIEPAKAVESDLEKGPTEESIVVAGDEEHADKR